MDDLPHFLLLLLILQRFDDAKWGYFTKCPQSGVGTEQVNDPPTYSFIVDTETGERITIVFYPLDHEIYLGITLIGRGTSVVGGRIGPPPEPTQFGDTSKIREGNDLVVKTYWPEESRTSEVEILRKAKEYGKRLISSATTFRRWFATWIQISFAVQQKPSVSSLDFLPTVPVACASLSFEGCCQLGS